MQSVCMNSLCNTKVSANVKLVLWIYVGCFELQNKYPVWADLKRWVIDQAVKEINEFSPLSVTYETKKTGRKITSINLRFKQKPKQAQIATETPKKRSDRGNTAKTTYRASNRKIQRNFEQIRQYFGLIKLS